MSFWEKLGRVFGFKPPEPEKRLAETKADRWGRLLKALQVSPSALDSALERELSKGLSEQERKISIPKEAHFFDGLLLRRKLSELDRLCERLDPQAIRSRVMGKVPSLRDWAIGNLGEGALLRASAAESVAWARQGGHFEPSVLREAHLAEAIEGGKKDLALRELADAGLQALEEGELAKYMEAFASRKSKGLSKGLDGEGLNALAASLGGWDGLSDKLAGLGAEKLMDVVHSLLEALAEEQLVETAILEKAKLSSRKNRELIARIVAAQAAKSDKPVALRAAIEARASASGMSAAKAASASVDQAKVRVGKMDVHVAIDGGVGLYEIATLSGARGSQKVIEGISKEATKISAQRMDVLVEAAEKGVRQLVMRYSGEARESTKAWREAVKDWKEGVLGGMGLAEIQKVVDAKLSESSKAPRAPKA